MGSNTLWLFHHSNPARPYCQLSKTLLRFIRRWKNVELMTTDSNAANPSTIQSRSPITLPLAGLTILYWGNTSTAKVIASSSRHLNENLLLISHSYVTPNGSQRDLVRGPNKSLLRSTDSKGCLVKELHQRVSVQGPNAANRQGPKETPRGSLAKIILTKLKRDSTRRV